MTISKHDISASIPLTVDTSLTLDVVDANVALDESWSPYAQAELTCHLPNTSDLDLIDPRQGRRVRLRLCQRFGDSEPVSAASTAWSAGLSGLLDSEVNWTITAAGGTPSTDFYGDYANVWGYPVEWIVMERDISGFQVGVDCVITFDAEGYSGDASLLGQVDIDVVGGPAATVSTADFSTWQNISYTFTPTATTHTVRIKMYAGTSGDVDCELSDLLITGGITGDTLTAANLTTMYASQYASAISAQFGRPYNAFGTRASTRRSLDLALISREIDHEAKTMRLTLGGDEALLQYWALTGTAAQAPGSTSVRTIVGWALGKVGFTLRDGTADGTVESDATEWDPGVTAWEYLRPLVESAGLRLWCDEQRNWWLTEPLNGTTGDLRVSDAQLTRASDILGIGGVWYDAVVIKYRWTDSSGVEHIVYDSAAPESYTKVLSLEYERVWPGNGAAAAMLARAQGRGRSVSIEAVSDYSATPGQTTTITLPQTPIQTGMVSAVTWRLPDDEMQVTTRGLLDTPDTAWLFTPAGITWDDVAVGVDWTEYTYTEGA